MKRFDPSRVEFSFADVRDVMGEVTARYPLHRVCAVEATAQGADGQWVIHLERWCDGDGVPERVLVARDPGAPWRVVSVDGQLVPA